MSKPSTDTSTDGDRFVTIETPGASVVVHDFGPDDDELAPLLISHATGFHGRCYRPVANELTGTFRSWAMDHRGHGLTPVPTGWVTDWRDCGVDTAVVGRQLAPEGGLVGFGHSMGGATLLIAAALDPTLFRRLVLMEPIAPPPSDEPYDPDQNRLVQSALRRRRVFDSYDDAYDNYHRKPPLSLMDPRALREYVDGGFRPVTSEPDGATQPRQGAVELRCTPEFEASVFTAAHSNGIWSMLPMISTPTLVVSGRVEPDEPSSWAEGIADRLPNGEFIVCDDQTHFGPFSHVADTATLIKG